MNQRAPGLTWLDRNDPKQQKWAHQYLQRKGEIDQQYSSTIEQLLQIGEKLERSREGILILGKMRGTWRKVKSNASDKDKDRKTYAFKLKIDVKKDLAWLAKKNKITAADMLGRLISDERGAYVRFEEKLNEAQKDNETLMRLLDVSVAWLCRSEILLQDATFSTETITRDQLRRIKELREQTMAEADAEIAGTFRLYREGLLDRTIKGIHATRHAQKEAVANTTDSTPKHQTGLLTSKKSVTHQQTQEAKPGPSSAIMIDSIENTSPHPGIGGPYSSTQPATQSSHSRYRIYASIGKDGIMSSFTKQRPTETDSIVTPTNPPTSAKQKAQPNENTSPHYEPDKLPLSVQTTTQSPRSRDEPPQTLGDILRKEEEEARRLEAETRPV
jgi:hypothetical protein